MKVVVDEREEKMIDILEVIKHLLVEVEEILQDQLLDEL
jgi:predicted house-cleaning noncanonical NTP pyrophosphatase (MazG superfamily)